MIFCQSCKTANPYNAGYCLQCGTRLLLISARRPGAMQDVSDNSLEEHLLERISALEAAIARANDRFEQLLELAQQQATGNFYDHMMLESLTDLLGDHGLVEPHELERRWKKRVARHYEESIERERLDERCTRIMGQYSGAERERFEDLVDQGVMLLGDGQVRRGLRLLESASLLDEANIELFFLVGEYYFNQGKAAEATKYLRRVLEINAEHFGAHLLLGLLVGEDGDAEEAKSHLLCSLSLDRNSFAAHYGLGRLLAREGRMREALSHLRRALNLTPAPEMHYLIGRILWEQGKADQALKHLQKAVRLDPRFDAALYNLGLIYWKTNRTHEARAHFRAAYEINPRLSHYRAAIQAHVGDEVPVPPAIDWNCMTPRRKTKSSELRFIELLRRDLTTFSLASMQSRKKS
ncbi:MAG TPA: tetratricopeptide repeat protein [Blastocatellia bacterium]|nr:tetratricopeptide repeat protein [Blastocatellia bacterium]